MLVLEFWAGGPAEVDARCSEADGMPVVTTWSAQVNGGTIAQKVDFAYSMFEKQVGGRRGRGRNADGGVWAAGA